MLIDLVNQRYNAFRIRLICSIELLLILVFVFLQFVNQKLN